VPRVTFVKGLLGFSPRLFLSLSFSLSLSYFLVDRLFRPFFDPTHGERVLNYFRRTSSDCSAVIACQLLAFDVIKLILGPNFGPRQRAKGQLLSGFPLFAKNFPWGYVHHENPFAPLVIPANHELSHGKQLD